MGLLLEEEIDINLVKTALLAFFSIGISIILINFFPGIKRKLPNSSYQLGALIGNTSFLGIPIAMALLPSETRNFTVGFDLGTTLFSWIFGPFLLQKNAASKNIPNLTEVINALLNSPASRGIIGVLFAYHFKLEGILGNYLKVPTKIIIALAIIIVGTRLGIIKNQKDNIFDLNVEIKYSILLKLFIFPLIIFCISKFLNFNTDQSLAVVLQAAAPTAISTILMAEAYEINEQIAAKILFTTTLISIITIPFITFFLNLNN